MVLSCLCLSPCICHRICLFYLYHDIFPKFSMASRHSRNISRSRREDALRVEGGRGSISPMYQWPFYTVCKAVFLHSNWKMLHLAKFVYTTSGYDGCGNYKVCWLRCSLNIWRFQCFFCSYWHRCWYYWWWMTLVWLMPYLKHFFLQFWVKRLPQAI